MVRPGFWNETCKCFHGTEFLISHFSFIIHVIYRVLLHNMYSLICTEDCMRLQCINLHFERQHF